MERLEISSSGISQGSDFGDGNYGITEPKGLQGKGTMLKSGQVFIALQKFWPEIVDD